MLVLSSFNGQTQGLIKSTDHHGQAVERPRALKLQLQKPNSAAQSRVLRGGLAPSSLSVTDHAVLLLASTLSVTLLYYSNLQHQYIFYMLVLPAITV